MCSKFDQKCDPKILIIWLCCRIDICNTKLSIPFGITILGNISLPSLQKIKGSRVLYIMLAILVTVMVADL